MVYYSYTQCITGPRDKYGLSYDHRLRGDYHENHTI